MPETGVGPFLGWHAGLTQEDSVDLRRLQDDLKGFFRGDVLFDDISRQLYSTDASIFQVRPAGVVLPRDEEDVSRLVRYSQENSFPLIARGAGTGLAGESLGPGLIVDLSKHFREIPEVSSDRVRVQPGVTCAALNLRLAEIGRRLAPDPASGSVCTVGGMLANNASGSRALKYGTTREHVHSLRAVLDNGDTVTIGRSLSVPADDTLTPHLRDIVMALNVLLEQNQSLIAANKVRAAFNRLGYQLHGVLQDRAIDLPRLLVGSEGTLALFTEVVLHTMPIPAGRALVLANVASLARAIHLVQRILSSGPSACDLIDRRLLSLARGQESSAAASLISPAAEAVLFIEFEADTLADARQSATELAQRLQSDATVIHTTVAAEPEQLAPVWQIRELALPSLYGQKGGPQPVACIEDVGVPVDALHEYLRRVQDILQEHETTASFLIHAGAGQVHTRPFLDLQKPDHVSRLWAIAEKVHSLAVELGGTVSSQHGTGLARTAWVARQAGLLYPVLRQVKAIFDPKNIFNPGKIVDPDPAVDSRSLRQWPANGKEAASLKIYSQREALNLETHHCNGCGECRSEIPEQRMCPIFRATHAEAATPRAKANLLRQLLQTSASGMPLGAAEVRAVADLCVHCKMCASECPAHVDIPKLMLEAKAANVAEHGVDRSDWLFARLESVLRWGSAASFLSNIALKSRTSRWLLDKFFGLSPTRRLPRLTSRPFVARARRQGLTQKPTGEKPVVVYFVDLYANFLDPQIAEAAVAVLKHHGFDVYVPVDQRSSGMEALVHGDVETAREIARDNLRLLAEAARIGWPIVCSEPSAAVMLKQEYPDLQADDDARAVREKVFELTSFLWELHRERRLQTGLKPIDVSVGHHVPCHVKGLDGPIAGPALLNLIPNLRLNVIDVGCSGMAGTFGLKSANVNLSKQAGAAMLAQVGRPKNLFGSSECSSCRMQMEDAAGKRSLHPVQYLALAYGLLPEVADRLREPIGELVLR